MGVESMFPEAGLKVVFIEQSFPACKGIFRAHFVVYVGVFVCMSQKCCRGINIRISYSPLVEAVDVCNG
jgi:hypothetical protein